MLWKLICHAFCAFLPMKIFHFSADMRRYLLLLLYQLVLARNSFLHMHWMWLSSLGWECRWKYITANFLCCIHSVHLSLNLNLTVKSKLRSISSWTCCQIIGFKMFMCVPIRLRVYIRDIVFVHVICCVLLWSKLQMRTKLSPFAKTMWSCLHYNQDEQKCRLMLTNSFHLQELE